MIDGIQDKKVTLDNFYIRYSDWEKNEKEEIATRFLNILRELQLIFSGKLDISETRFRQKADFYTLFLVLDEFVSDGWTIDGKDRAFLQDDLIILQENIRPESDIQICSEYAIKCVSQANSASSRNWRHRFLKPILSGTYIGRQSDGEGAQVFYRLMEELSMGDSMGFCPEPVFNCEICNGEISGNFADCVLAWHKSATAKQIANADWIHRSCIKGQFDWIFLERPNDDQLPLFRL